MTTETGAMRAKRRRQRVLFDGVADLYQAVRRGYPPALVQFAVDTAGLRPGSTVLEVGCGTGQLTERLAAHDLAVAAIDIGSAMIEAARRRVRSSLVSFEAVSFEAFSAPDACFDLIASATAFHWIDPEVKFAKSARLLKAGGWLALMATAEQYDDPFGTVLREMWMARSDHAAAWTMQHPPAAIDLTGTQALFGSALHRSHSQRIALPVETVIGVETTRATFLSWPEQDQRAFVSDLRRRLPARADVHLTQQTSLTMAQVLPRA